MASENVVQITDQNFEQEVLQSDVPVLIDFWATWCGPCVAIAPTIDQLADEYAGKVKVAKMDIDSNQGTPANLGVMSIPTLIVFKNGQEVDRQVGAASKNAISGLIEKNL